MMKRYCDFCHQDVEVTAVVEKKDVQIDNIYFSYDAEVLHCPKCGETVYDVDIADANVKNANEIYRKKSRLSRLMKLMIF